MRNRWLVLAAAVAAVLSSVLVALSTQAPALAGSGTKQAGPFGVGNLLSYANSDFEGQANFIPVANVGTISDSSAAALHGSDSLEFTSPQAEDSVLKLQEGSSATQIDVNPGGQPDTYTLGGWFKLPPDANQNENVTFSLGLYKPDGTWLGWAATSPLTLSATTNWQYVQGQVTAQISGTTAAWALDSPQITLGNPAANQVTYMDMLVFEPYRAAQAIGAHGECTSPCTEASGTEYSDTDWMTAYDALGQHLQSDKEFIDTPIFPNGDLPSNFNQTICSAIEGDLGSTSYSKWPVCILAYTGTLSTSDTTAQADMNAFLSTVPSHQELYIVWQQEPEGKNFSNPPQPGCPASDTDSQAFVCEFERQSGFVHNSPDYGPNIFVAMDSAGSHYGDVTDDNSPGDDTASDGTQDPNTKVNCPWIVPNSNNSPGGADIYLVDFYQNSAVDGGNVNTEALREDNWKNWLSCATARNRPIGFGEYGLDETSTLLNQPAPCTNDPNDATEAPIAMGNDQTYLEQLPMSGQAEMQNPVPVAMWDYWYSDYGGTPVCTLFTSANAISTWEGIETANGGG